MIFRTIAFALLGFVLIPQALATPVVGCWEFTKFNDGERIQSITLRIAPADNPKKPSHITQLSLVERKNVNGEIVLEESGGNIYCRPSSNRHEFNCRSDEGRANMQIDLSGDVKKLSIILLNTVEWDEITGRKTGILLQAPKEDPFLSSSGTRCSL